MRKNEKGFALVLSLVLMLVMSLMGGALIVISAGDHQSNNRSEDYQQTFYVAETALIEGERYILNQFLGPWNTSTHKRDTAKRNLPANQTSKYTGNMTQKNYNSRSLGRDDYLSPSTICYNSFSEIDKDNLKVVTAESWNFGIILRDSFNPKSGTEQKKEIDKLFIQKGLKNDLFAELWKLVRTKRINYKHVPAEKINRITKKSRRSGSY